MTSQENPVVGKSHAIRAHLHCATVSTPIVLPILRCNVSKISRNLPRSTCSAASEVHSLIVTGLQIYCSRYGISQALKQVIKPFELLFGKDYNLGVCIIGGSPCLVSVSGFLKRFGPEGFFLPIPSGLTSEGLMGASDLL